MRRFLTLVAAIILPILCHSQNNKVNWRRVTVSMPEQGPDGSIILFCTEHGAIVTLHSRPGNFEDLKYRQLRKIRKLAGEAGAKKVIIDIKRLSNCGHSKYYCIYFCPDNGE